MSASAQAAPSRPWAVVDEPVRGEDRLLRYFRWLPLLWLSGLHVIVPMFLTFRLALSRWPAEAAANLLAGAWALVTLAQGVSVAYNWSLAHETNGFLVGRLLSSTTLGWGIVGVALAAGCAWRLSGPVMVRGVCTMGLWIAVIGPLALALGIATGIEALRLPTPTSIILGQSDAVEFYAIAPVFQKEESSFGLPRLVLFFPWSTALSLAGICITMIALTERDRFWRAAGIAGGVVAVAFSFSRAGYAVLPVCLAVYLAMRARPAPLIAGAMVACGVALALVLLELNPVRAFNDLVHTMRESRAGSSQARDQIYEASWEGFLDRPILGWGWVGGSIISQEEIRVGSHSSVYGTLYTGGAATFGALAVAGASTLATVVTVAVRTRTREAAAAAAVMTALVMFSYGEAMYSIVPAILFALLFVGGTLARPDPGPGGRP